jgi:hypothetical protein
MKINLTYITDSKGNQKAIQIPIDEWNQVQKEIQKLIEFKKLKLDLYDSFKEIALFESDKRKPRTLSQFINGL